MRIAVIPKTAWTPAIESWARQKGILRSGGYAARRGDLVLFQMPGPNRINHVGIVVKDRAAGAPLYCVEGNTGGTNPRAGGMVAATIRTQYIVYIVDMRKEYAPEPVAATPVTTPKETPVSIDYTHRYVAGWAEDVASRDKVVAACLKYPAIQYTIDGPMFTFHASLARVKEIEAVIASDPKLHRAHAFPALPGTHIGMGTATKPWVGTFFVSSVLDDWKKRYDDLVSAISKLL
jgi:hypothetical protein